MKITEYPKVSTMANNDRFIIESKEPSGGGTRGISLFDLTQQIGAKGDLYKALDDQNIPVGLRRQIFRGINIGYTIITNEDNDNNVTINKQITDEQWNSIADGSFKDMFIGDYWILNSELWRIVDFDYWYGTGDTACTKHHVVIMPDNLNVKAAMNDGNTTSGGYVNSKMRTETLGPNSSIRTSVLNTFGSGHILTHRSYFTNNVSGNYPVSGAWCDSDIEIPSEIMIFGSNLTTDNYTTTGDKADVYEENPSQLSLMAIEPDYINPIRNSYWLRNVVSNTMFSTVYAHGGSYYTAASMNNFVRPVFGICKSN